MLRILLGLLALLLVPLNVAAQTVTHEPTAAPATERVTYIHTDALGSPILGTDAQGNVVWQEDYQPYGERFLGVTAPSQRLYTGKYAETRSGLVDFGGRWYNPEIGRFYSVDPQGFDAANPHSFNRYAYANNNPYRYIDPDGEVGVLAPLLYGLSVAGAGYTAYDTTTTYLNEGAGAALQSLAVDGAATLALGGAGRLATGVAGRAVAGGATEARAARDALAAELAPLKGKAPATVTGGYNIKTGEVAARACGGGKCAEDHVFDALGGVKDDVRFTEAVRPRTGAEVPVCPRCEASFGRGVFPPNTRFKTDE